MFAAIPFIDSILNNTTLCKAVIDGLVYGIALLCAWGFICIIKAWWDLHREWGELKAFQSLENLSKEVVDNHKPKNKNFREDATAADHLTYRRLKVICDMLDRGKGTKGGKRNTQAPQMGDLHQLTEQAIMSSLAPTSLRIITSTLLICGICGTLWGVHEVIQEGITTNLKGFAPALNPSKLAVFFTIFFFMLRGWYVAGVDLFLCRLDRETMINFLPKLTPSSDLSQEISKLATAISGYNTAVADSMVPVEEAVNLVKENSLKVKEAVTKIIDADSTLDKLIERVSKTSETISNDQQVINDAVFSSQGSLSIITQSLDEIKGLNTKLNETIIGYAADMGNIQTSLGTSLSSLQDSTAQAQLLAEKAKELNAGLASIGDVNAAAAKLETSIQNAITSDTQAFKSLRETVSSSVAYLDQTKQSIAALTTHTSNLESLSVRISSACENTLQSAKQIKTNAENFDTHIKMKNDEISRTASVVRAYHPKLTQAAEEISAKLAEIRKDARSLVDRLPNPENMPTGQKVKRMVTKFTRKN